MAGQIEARELSPDDIGVLRRQALDGLVLLQEKVVQETLYPSVNKEAFAEPSVVEKAAENAAWAMQVIPVVSEILLKTGARIQFSETLFTRSEINCEAVGIDKEKHIALRFGSKEVTGGNVLGVFEEAWGGNFGGAKRNIQALANLTPLDVIGKAYRTIYRI